MTYKVKPGDTLSKIAKLNGCSMDHFCASTTHCWQLEDEQDIG